MCNSDNDVNIVKALGPDAQRLYEENKPEILGTARQLLQGTEDYFSKNANKQCSACDGKGKIRYHFDEDDCKTAPCIRCFPNNPQAIEMARQFRESSIELED